MRSISEGGSPSQGAGTGDLERLIILSPTIRVPAGPLATHRITVSPRRVEAEPGLSRRAAAGRHRSSPQPQQQGEGPHLHDRGALPTRTLRGLVVDWSTNRPASQALVEALLVADSLPYHGITDSTGRFSLGPLPSGDYLVKGVIDENHDFRPGIREAFDSIRILAKDTAVRVGELWTFVHDTAPARIRTITVADSVSATVEFNQFSTRDNGSILPR